MQAWTNAASAPVAQKPGWSIFCAFLAPLLVVYGGWLAVFLPGILGQDSLAVLLEIQNPDGFRSGKPAFWYYFVRLFFQPTQMTEAPIAAVLVLGAVVFARILSWCWVHQLRKVTLFSLVFICLAPHTIYFLGTLYPDAAYSVAVTGLLFECWLGTRKRWLSRTALAMIALTLPFAVFARQNGIIFLIPAALLLFMVDRASRLWLAIILVAWCALMAAGSRMHKTSGHGVLFPLAIYETVGFLQPRPMNLWTAQPRVSPSTVELLTRHHPLHVYQAHYDPDYWDPLQFAEDGPHVLSFPQADQKQVVQDFFRYNLWHNLPKFLGSRLNLFLVAALAQGGLPDYAFAEQVLNKIQPRSTYRTFQLHQTEHAWMRLFDVSYAFRWMLWTPFLGVGLLVWLVLKGFRERDVALLMLTTPLLVQLGAIFTFSIAGEYRYLLPFFLTTAIMLPIAVVHQQARSESIATNP